MKRRRNVVLCLLGWILLAGGCSGGGTGGNVVTMAPLPTAISAPTPTLLPMVAVTLTPKATPTATATPMPTATPTNAPTPEPLDITICFTGDISLAEDAVTIEQWKNANGELGECISPELLEMMRAADVLCVNNEFTFTTRGEPLKGKTHTFRSNPEKVSLLLEMGVDLALLANNHAYDYGEISLLDTLDTLSGVGIGTFGAGRNLEEAMQPYYVEADGITIAFVAASRAEKNKKTPQATADSAGILRCYDTELFLDVIREADVNADVVLACVHWGTEYSTVLEEVQKETGKLYLDAGADAIIGSHSHCLQGMELYDGKPIAYSLGNFWFNGKTLDTVLLRLHITGERENPELQVELIPAKQANRKTTKNSSEKDMQKWYQYMESISVNIEINEKGMVIEK